MNEKIIILGLGNTILTDDGVGIYVVRKIGELLSLRAKRSNLNGIATAPSWPRNDATIKEASLGGFNFIDLLAGYDRAVIIDAIHTKGGTPGEFYELDISALKPSARLSSLHQIDFATACDLAKKMGIAFPKEFAIFVMEVEDEFSFGEKPTPKVAESIPKMAESIITTLRNRKWLK